MRIKVTYVLCLTCKTDYRTQSFTNMTLAECPKCRKRRKQGI